MKCRLAIGLDFYDLAGSTGTSSDTQGLQVTYSVNAEQVAYLGVDEARQFFRPGSNVTASFSSTAEFATVADCEAEIGRLYEFLKDQDGTVTAYLGGITYDGTNQVETATAAGTAQTEVSFLAESGSSIYYTIDGTDPTTSSSSIANGGSILFSGTGIVKSIASRSGFNSPISSKPVITSGTVAAATISPDSSLVNAASVTVTVTAVTDGSTLHYTTNGTTPTTGSSTVASGGTVSVPVPGTIKVLAVKAGLSNSPIKQASYADPEIPEITTTGSVETGVYESGGTVYRWHQFNGDGTIVAPSNITIDYLVAGGGGAGGGRITVAGGGGGAGQIITASGQTLAAGTHNITIGQGGVSKSTAGVTSAQDGTSTIFGAIATAIGGGGGGIGTSNAGRSGGSGGGGAGAGNGGNGTAGFDGGNGLSAGRAGGGGGAAANGSTQSSESVDLARAAGIVSTIKGVSETFGAGGGVSNTQGTTDGKGWGGNGRSITSNSLGHNGGPGVVIIRYALSSYPPTPPTLTSSSNSIATGNVSVTVAQSGGSYVLPVQVSAGDTASVWAGKVRTALAGDVFISKTFSVSGSGTSIILTSRRHQEDAALNIAIDNGSPSPGITPVATSTNVQAGSADTLAPVMTIYGAIAQVSATYRGKSITIDSSITGRTTS